MQAPTYFVFPPEFELNQDKILVPKRVLATRLIKDQQDEFEQWLIQWDGQEREKKLHGKMLS